MGVEGLLREVLVVRGSGGIAERGGVQVVGVGVQLIREIYCAFSQAHTKFVILLRCF